jgi:MFS transporter, SP family, solute carrier family 2 (myo-inositol transporter), member 13
MTDSGTAELEKSKVGYNRFLLLVAGLGGLLYGVDVGIVAGALPYLEATSGLNAGQLSIVVAAVLLGSVFSTLFAGLLADWLGRKWLMIVSGLMFVVSIPVIALSHGYGPLVMGRLLQGVSAGFIGVVVPLYLAECLSAATRGKGTAMFQWLLTLGIVSAALVGMYFSIRVDEVAALGDPGKLFDFKDHAWRGIFWVSLPPGILFVLGSFAVAESPRWLFRRGKKEAALNALLRSRSAEQAQSELREMEETSAAEKGSLGSKVKESLLRRKYVIPFVLACVILACNTATGINSIIGFNTNILLQSGLSDVQAHWGYVLFTMMNFLFTMVGVVLVDRKGRKFLLSIGTAGVILALVCTALLFHRTERTRVDAREAVQAMVGPDQKLSLHYDPKTADAFLGRNGVSGNEQRGTTSLSIIYSYGDFRAASKVVRSDDLSAKPVEITRDSTIPANKVIAFFSNPFGNLDAAQTAPLKIDNAWITPMPSTQNGWLLALTLYLFVAFYASGPGVCVWLALSELMPTRIRSNGMSIALLINQGVSTTFAAIFLPTVGKYGYASMFFVFAACTVVYFVTATFFLPETKGKTLEEIEAHFERAAART